MITARPNGVVLHQNGNGSSTSIRRKPQTPPMLGLSTTELVRLQEQERVWALRKKLSVRAVIQRGEGFLTGNMLQA